MCGSQHTSLAHHHGCIPHIIRRLVHACFLHCDLTTSWGANSPRQVLGFTSVRRGFSSEHWNFESPSACLSVSHCDKRCNCRNTPNHQNGILKPGKSLDMCSLVKTKEVLKTGQDTQEQTNVSHWEKYYVVPRWRKQSRNKMQAIIFNSSDSSFNRPWQDFNKLPTGWMIAVRRFNLRHIFYSWNSWQESNLFWDRTSTSSTNVTHLVVNLFSNVSCKIISK